MVTSFDFTGVPFEDVCPLVSLLSAQCPECLRPPEDRLKETVWPVTEAGVRLSPVWLVCSVAGGCRRTGRSRCWGRETGGRESPGCRCLTQVNTSIEPSGWRLETGDWRLTYTVEGQRKVAGWAPALRGKMLATGAHWAPSCCSWWCRCWSGVIFTKVWYVSPPRFARCPQGNRWRVRWVFVGSQPRIWETSLQKLQSDLHLTGFHIIVRIPIFPRFSPIERSYFCITWCSWNETVDMLKIVKYWREE